MLHNPTGLRKLLIEKIRREGPISFRDFMRQSLYHEEFGYYSRKELAIGKNGDFVTAPHASRFFGSLIAVQLIECFEHMKGESFSICEFGAGAGYLAYDIMKYLKDYEPEYFGSLTYFIIEPIENRIPVLAERLSDFSGSVKIIPEFSEVGGFSGVILANELLDAFPVHLVQKEKGNFFEIYIDVDQEGNLCEIAKEISHGPLSEYLQEIGGIIPDNYRTEINIAMKDWIGEISSSMERGYVILIDYGYPAGEYYAPYRNRGTLLGYTRQRITEDFLSYPGMVDITAHVNFTDLRKWAGEKGFRCEGFTPQWAFLGGLDPDETMNRVFGTIDPFSPVLAGIKALIFPQAMGETHKVIIFSRNLPDIGPLKGFRLKDYKELLDE